jgi:hypothetical protein
MAIYYLDDQDEITSAAARIRDSSDTRIALVLSGGSRVATSRINFRLLAGEAKRRNKKLAIVAADPSVQSVARSAGLAVFATVGSFEKAEAARAGGGSEAAAGENWEAFGELTTAPGPRASSGRLTGGPTSRGGSAGQQRGRARRVPRSFVAALAGVIVLVVGLGTFFFYPSATVALTLREEPVGPMNLSVTVDPTASTSNDQKATVPGVKEAFPVEASGSFSATGENVVETPATGTVTFSSENTFLAVPIPAGTRLSTASGIAFATTSAVTVPKAVFGTGRGVVDAPVAAVVKGLSGNVAARTITRVPADLASALVAASPVTNKSATTGGTHTVTPMIVQADIDAAESSLTSLLQSSFQAALAAPGAVPSGSDLFSDTARLGAPTFFPDPQGLLNQAVTSFDLNAAATGTAVVADLSTVRTVAESRIKSAVRSGYGLVGGSITTQLGTAATQGDAVVVPVTALGLQTPIVDAGQLLAAVQGRSVEEARTYLAKYGRVEISVSPGWASTMPSFDFRIDLQLLTASPQPTVSASASVVATPTPPAATPSASPTGGSPPPSPPTSPPPSPSLSPPPGQNSPSPSAS